MPRKENPHYISELDAALDPGGSIAAALWTVIAIAAALALAAIPFFLVGNQTVAAGLLVAAAAMIILFVVF